MCKRLVRVLVFDLELRLGPLAREVEQDPSFLIVVNGIIAAQGK